MDEKLFFHWETQVIVITIVFELIMIASIVYVWWGISLKEKLMESIARIVVILVIIGANVSLFTKVPMWVKCGGEEICIQKIIGKKNIPYEDINSIELIAPKVISGSIRKGASGGAGGYVGRFKNKSLGMYTMYATEKKDLVLVQCEEETIVFNCRERDGLVEYINGIIERENKYI